MQRIVGQCNALFQRRRMISSIECCARIEHDHFGRFLPVFGLASPQGIADQLQRCSRAFHGQADQALAFYPHIFRLYPVFSHFAIFQLGHEGRCREAELVQTILGVHHQYVLASETKQDFGQRPAQRLTEHPYHLMADASRIRKRAKHIKQGAQSKVATRTSGVFHCAVVGLGKHEADAHAFDTAGNLHRRQVQIDTRRLKQIGAATFAGHSPITVLGNRATSRRDHKGRCCGDVKNICAIAARANHVDHAVEGLEFDFAGQLTHDRNSTDDFINAFAFHAHGHHEGAYLRFCALTCHDFAHDVAHFLGAQIKLVDDASQRAFDIHSHNLESPLTLTAAASLLEEVGEQLMSLLGKNRLRVKLHPLDI